MRLPLLLAVVHLLALAAPPVLAASQCYFPDGSTSGDTPCDPDAEVSLCCGSESSCLTNGLCIVSATNSTGNSFARGTCTDRTWTSNICPQHCQKNPDAIAYPNDPTVYNFGNGGVQIWQCGDPAVGFGSPASYCCESAAEKRRCCSTTLAVFNLAAATIGNPSLTSSTSTPASTSTSTSPTSSDFSPQATISSPKETGGSSSPSPASSGSSGLSSGVKIGLGVGIPVVLAALAGIFYLVWQSQQKRINALEEHIRGGRQYSSLPDSMHKPAYGYELHPVGPEVYPHHYHQTPSEMYQPNHPSELNAVDTTPIEIGDAHPRRMF